MKNKRIAFVSAGILMMSLTSCGMFGGPSSGFKVGDTFEFGRYEQDGNLSNGAEPITWRVLKKNGNALTIISEKAIVRKEYNDTNANVTWETCTLRTWLNSDFYESTFSQDEKDTIMTTSRRDLDNTYYGEDGGNPTDDKVWLLTYNEAKSWLPKNKARRCEPTEYAKPDDDYIDGGYCCWWLASPGSSLDTAACVGESGTVDNCASVNHHEICARPALTIVI